MFHLIQDIRFALRVIRRNPVTSGVIVLTLALGIGANTAMFATFDVWVLRPLDFANPERLVTVYEFRTALGERSGVAPANLRDWQAASRSLDAFAAYDRHDFNLQVDDHPERVEGARVDAELFGLLGIEPVQGRLFQPEEDLANGPAVALISHTTWQRRYDFDPEVLGRTVRLDGKLHEIVGVMPPGFEFPEWAHVWTPLGLEEQATERERRLLSVVGRLAPGVSVDEAQAEMAGIAERLATTHPEANAGWGVRVLELRAQWVPPVIRLALWVSVILAGAVLLVICANVANLLMAQANRRRREVALRSALGASRKRLLGQTLTESLVLASAGGFLGAGFGSWWGDWMMSWAPISPPYLFRFAVDDRALLYTLGVVVATALLCALATVVRSTGFDVGETLKSGGGRSMSSSGGRHLRRALVVGEFAVTMLLSIGALLMVKSFLLEQRIDLGYRTDGILTMRLSLDGPAYEDPDRRVELVDEVLTRTSGLAGVEAAGIVDRLPVSHGGYVRARLEAEGQPKEPGTEPTAALHHVTRGYLETLELPLVEGRGFTAGEAKEGADVALVSQSLARQLWPEGSALGRRLRLVDGDEVSWRRVIGVTGDVDPGHSMVEGTWPRTQVYMPLGAAPATLVSFAVRGDSADPLRWVPQIRDLIARVGPGVSVFEVMTLEQAIERVHWVSSLFSRLFVYYAMIALAIAALGAYGVLADSVAQRRREMGVRLALGARPGDLLQLVVRQGVVLGAAGVVLGMLMAIPTTRFLTSMLYEVSAGDPAVFGGVAILLLAVAWFAAYLPARRAARVDPMEVLRFE